MDHESISKQPLYQFFREFDKEVEGTSDRGVAAAGPTGIEFLLKELLSYRIVESINPEKVLFQKGGPLHEYGQKCTMAHALGLISDDEKREIELVGRIRNKLAHSPTVSSFTDPSVKNICSELKLCEKLYSPKVIPFVAWSPDGKTQFITKKDSEYPILSKEELTLPNKNDPRIRFINSIQALLRVLSSRFVVTGSSNILGKSTKPTVPDEFEYPEDPYQAVVEDQQKIMELLADRETRPYEDGKRILRSRKEILEKAKDVRERFTARNASTGTPVDDDKLKELDDLIEKLEQKSDEEYLYQSPNSFMTEEMAEEIIAMTKYGNEVIRRSRAAHGM